MNFEPILRNMATVPIYKLSAMTKGTPGIIRNGGQTIEAVRVREGIFVVPQKVDSRFQFFAFASGMQIQAVSSAADFQQLRDQLKEVDYEPKVKSPRSARGGPAKADHAPRPEDTVRNSGIASDKRRGNQGGIHEQIQPPRKESR